ncbi:MAG: 50S ribosomal protein L4 [Bacilli bacterium]|nr:50S ribosomal protein L4 [Bacilli bacterium]MDD4734076.1 50S ribosomal protein L4 [Bacilli bacterium]
MKKISILNVKGEKVKDITLNENIWGIEPNDAVLHDAIILARHNQRQGTVGTKTRAEVQGGGRKPWRQKGTGRARQGSIRSPQWVGGGIVFGPQPRSFFKKQNRKERRLALRSALSYKLLNSELVILDDIKFETNKTKDAIKFFKDLEATKNVLVVVDELDENIILATRNLDEIVLLQSDEINVLDLVSADKVIITEKAVKNIEEVLV